MTQVPKRDAVKGRTCDTCQFWHNPEGQAFGLCIYYPPQAIMTGMMQVPPPAIVDPKRPQPMMGVPVVQGFHPPREPKQGCAKHEPVERLN